ncbi:MAG: endonuclease MutS2 [Oscillospiraceae bacterium]|nr:endonuclease MutS2 [Oscillospiraceae bacterium]
MTAAEALASLEYGKVLERLAGLAVTAAGKERCAGLGPIEDMGSLRGAMAVTGDAAAYISSRGSPPMGGLNDVRPCLHRVGIGGVLDTRSLTDIGSLLRTVRRLKGHVGKRADNGGCLIVAAIDGMDALTGLDSEIGRCVLNEEELADEASPELASLRRRIREMRASVKDRLDLALRGARMQKAIQEPIVTLRGGRYVIPVKQEYRQEVPGLVHDSSASGQTLFIEPMAVVEANNEIRHLCVKEGAEVERILHVLTALVEADLTPLAADAEALADLDFAFAKARLSIDLACTAPSLTCDGKVTIRKGRHPLLDPRKAVPIDFWIGDGFTTLVVTGPNTGGKTVALKTVGLLTLMAQSGLHVPAADGTSLSVFKGVYVDIGDEQSIEQSLSTFSSHMRNIISILGEAGEGSLVLLDELGAGTDPAEGSALAMAILEGLRHMGAITVATTHYSEIKVFASSTPGVENACCEFDVETLSPTYRLLIGLPGKSNAFAISRRLGLAGEIEARAREFMTGEGIRFEDMLMDIERKRMETEGDRTQASIAMLEAERIRDELEKGSRRLREQREKILAEARDEARRMFAEAKKEAAGILERMRVAEKAGKAESWKEAETLRQALGGMANSYEAAASPGVGPLGAQGAKPGSLRVGDRVVLTGIGKEGSVAKVLGGDEAVVQVGIIKVTVPIGELRLAGGGKAGGEAMGTGFAGVSGAKAMSVQSRIDLRGDMVEEAIVKLDKYLDDVAMTGIKEISVIHGKGTGALRSGVHKYLRGSGRVRSFRLGEYGEGDSGVTIAEMA